MTACWPGRRRRGPSSGSISTLAEENGAQRQRRAHAAGASLEEIYAAEVAETQRSYSAAEVRT